MATNGFYVYAYLDPGKPGIFQYGEYRFNHEPFYIGKGKKNRAKVFCDHKGNFVQCKIKSINNAGMIPIIHIVKNKCLESDAIILEKKLITLIGRRDIGMGPLTNLTDGGDGTSGYNHSLETRLRMSKKRKGRKFSKETLEKRSNSLKGRIVTAETRQKISKTLTGYKHSDAFCKKVSDAGKKRGPISEKTRQKLRDAKLGFQHSEETKRNQSQTMKKYWAGHEPFWKGKKMSKQAKLNMSNNSAMSCRWVLVSPNGDQSIIENLEKFCRENDLDVSGMRRVNYGEYRYYNGWQCYNLNKWSKNEIKKKVNNVFQWVVVSPNGEEHRPFSLRKFCSEHLLSYQCLWNVVKGRTSHHKGWICMRGALL